jgi:hypothetical protein
LTDSMRMRAERTERTRVTVSCDGNADISNLLRGTAFLQRLRATPKLIAGLGQCFGMTPDEPCYCAS